MKKVHIVPIAAALAVAAVFGLVAATRTTGVGTKAQAPVSSTAIAARSHRLDRVEASLRRALRDRPPALPAVPAARPVAAPPAAQIIYRRPAPIVIVKHAAHQGDEQGHERSDGGGEGD